MTIESTAPPQARHKPRAQKRSKTTEQQPDKEALLLIDSEPALSSDGDDWYYFWYKIPGQKKNANGSGKSINCRKYQISWVKEAYESNTLLQRGVHFEGKYIDTPDGPAAQRFRFVLQKDCCLPDEPEPDDDLPMAWDQPGNEVPVVQDEPPKVPPADPEVMRRMDTWFRVLAECGVEPSPDRIAETAAGFCTSVEISKERRGNR